MLPKVSAQRRDFDDETKYMPFLITDDKLLKNIMKFAKNSANVLKMDFTVSLYTMKTI